MLTGGRRRVAESGVEGEKLGKKADCSCRWWGKLSGVMEQGQEYHLKRKLRTESAEK